MSDDVTPENTQPVAPTPLPKRGGGAPMGLLIGVLVLAVLGIGGVVAIIFAVTSSRNTLEQAAIQATVQAFSTATNTPIPTVVAGPTSTLVSLPTESSVVSLPPTATLEPIGVTVQPTEALPTPIPPTATSAPVQATTAPQQPTAAPQQPTVIPPTATPEPPTETPAAPVSSGRVVGSLQMCVSKPSYAANIENICVIETIQNPGNTPITYGIIGVRAENLSGGNSVFHTSWRGDLAIDAGCTGPTDRCGGPWQDNLTLEAGTYNLTLSICYSTINTCLNGGDWETLTAPIQIQVINWTPSP